jgi:nucleotide-binding universal stress UspA family protein
MKILLPIDHSICSSGAVRALIAQFSPDQTEVRVMHTVEWPKGLPPYLAFAEGVTAARDVLGARADQIESGRFLADGIAQELRAAGFATSIDVRDGDAKHMILAAADEWQPDIIVIGSHGRSGVDRFFIGSVAEYVMRHATCPVEVVPPAAARAFMSEACAPR